MKNIYEIHWTDHALNELDEVYDYLKANWTEKELRKLSLEIEKTIELISKNPELFPIINQDETIRRAVITKHNTIYYKKLNEVIEILSFFSNKKNPDKLDL